MLKEYYFDWSDLAFSSKKPLRRLRATFIVAPRQLSSARLTNLIKTHLSKGNVVLGISKEAWVVGYEDQPQFAMLRLQDVQPLVSKIAASKIRPKLYVLHYQQAELPFILDKIEPSQVVLVNGSWRHSFHTTPSYYTLVKHGKQPVFVSPFTSEEEAQETSKKLRNQIQKRHNAEIKKFINSSHSESALMQLAHLSAKQSFDHTFQTGAVLAKKSGSSYKFLLSAHNQIVPYETFAMHMGASRELHLSPPNDLNHYDTVHAEVQATINALNKGLKLKGTSLFVNLLPCPVCSRILILTGIGEIVYQYDHSDGYAVKLLTAAGLRVRRLVV